MGEIEQKMHDLSFEDFKNQNGIIYWWASDILVMLGYSGMSAFEKVIDRTTKVFITLGIKHYENIIPVHNPNINQLDFKLTRFACYLTVMNADSKLPQVAAVQAYFVLMTQKFEELLSKSEDLDRLMIRDEIKEGNKSLSSLAKAQGVEDYARFQNAGYIGMYNMLNVDLANRRGIPKEKLFEHMSRTELAANLFRITMTEERIKKEGLRGQVRLENAHKQVGSEVRRMVKENTGVMPENLPQSPELPEVKKDIKKGYKDISSLDK